MKTRNPLLAALITLISAVVSSTAVADSATAPEANSCATANPIAAAEKATDVSRQLSLSSVRMIAGIRYQGGEELSVEGLVRARLGCGTGGLSLTADVGALNGTHRDRYVDVIGIYTRIVGDVHLKWLGFGLGAVWNPHEIRSAFYLQPVVRLRLGPAHRHIVINLFDGEVGTLDELLNIGYVHYIAHGAGRFARLYFGFGAVNMSTVLITAVTLPVGPVDLFVSVRIGEAKPLIELGPEPESQPGYGFVGIGASVALSRFH